MVDGYNMVMIQGVNQPAADMCSRSSLDSILGHQSTRKFAQIASTKWAISLEPTILDADT